MGDNDDNIEQLNFYEFVKNHDSLTDNLEQDNNILEKENNIDNSKGEAQLGGRYTIVENNFAEEPSDYKDDSVNNSKNNESSNSNNKVKKEGKDNKKVNKNKDKSKIKLIALKIILVGDVAVGKTSIIGRYINNSFDDEYKCTVQAERQTKIIKEDDYTLIKLNIWDTVGQEKFRSLTRQYFQDSQGAIIVFDITKKKTFDYISKWIDDINNYGNNDTVIIILGNKSDLTAEREISENEIKNKLNKEYLYFEVSAKNGNNISMAFDKIIKLIMENRRINERKNKLRKEEEKPKSLTNLDHNLNEKSKKCC